MVIYKIKNTRRAGKLVQHFRELGTQSGELECGSQLPYNKSGFSHIPVNPTLKRDRGRRIVGAYYLSA